MRTGRLKIAILAAAVLAIALGFVFILLKFQSDPTHSEPALAAGREGLPSSIGDAPNHVSGASKALPAVQVLKPQRRDIARTLTLPANISPWYQATLYAKVPGYLKWMGFDKGDTVKKKQLLAVIDAPEVEQQYRQAQADYKIKRITYQRKYSVWKENPDVIAKQDVDVAEAEAEAAQHIMEHRRTLLEYTSVEAPFAGMITARFADPGTLIQSAAGSATQAAPLYTIMDLDTVRVYVSVPQEAALLAEPGIPATLSVKEAPEQVFRGTVTRTAGALDPATRTLLVEIDLPNPDHVLKPGMYVSATLDLARHLSALALPPTAVVTSDRGKSVFVVSGDTARRVPIKTGLDDGVWLEVTEGLSGDEDVVVVGKSSLTDGQAVLASAYALPAGKPSSQKF
jgi:RND family efflux transporter MFP subunit